MTVHLGDQSGERQLAVPTEPERSAADPEISVVWHGSLSMQRSIMRALHRELGDDPDAICSAYKETERASNLARVRGAEEMDSLLHARMLWREGMLKGWLRW